MFEWYQHISKNMVLSLKLSQATVHLSFCQKIRLLCQHQAMSRRNTVTVSEVLWLFFRAPRSDLKMRTLLANFRKPYCFNWRPYWPIVVSKRALPCPSYLSSDPTLQLSCCSIPLAGVSGAEVGHTSQGLLLFVIAGVFRSQVNFLSQLHPEAHQSCTS